MGQNSISTHPSSPVVDTRFPPVDGYQSDYGSATPSEASSTSETPTISLTKPHLAFLSLQLERLPAIERLRVIKLLFPNLYQFTAFGLTGLVTIDMLSKLQREDPGSPHIDLIFLDTLHHFDETLDLVHRVQAKYPNIHIHTYKPDGVTTAAEFETKYGARLWEHSSELYDWAAKVEPQNRAHAELNVAAELTGRRRVQGGQRAAMPIIEQDDGTGVVKINPLADWSFDQVRAYISENDVPYNALLDRGYKSVGDWHSTSPVAEGEDERAGRWKGQEKTECGIHNKKSRYAQFLAKAAEEERMREEEEKEAAAREKAERKGMPAAPWVC